MQDSFGSLQGRVTLVTAGHQHIGAAICRRFAGQGAVVAVHCRGDVARAAPVVEAIRDAGGTADAFTAELTDPAAVEMLLDDVCAAFGGIDVLVNNAGTYPVSPLLDMSLDDWRAMQAANVDTALLCLQAAARRMQGKGGAIINIASISASSPGPDHSHYNSAKAALVMLTRSAAQELGPRGIRVNAVSPGPVFRDGIREAWPDGVTRWESKVPLGRLLEVDDVADACLFLASDSARFVSGQDLVVDGGMLATSIY